MNTRTQSFELDGLTIPFDATVVSPGMERRLSKSNYGRAKFDLLRPLLGAGTRLLELGSEIGVISAVAAQTEGVEAVVAIDSNPTRESYVQALWADNNITTATAEFGVPVVKKSGTVKLYVRDPLWDSSTVDAIGDHTDTMTLTNHRHGHDGRSRIGCT